MYHKDLTITVVPAKGRLPRIVLPAFPTEMSHLSLYKTEYYHSAYKSQHCLANLYRAIKLAERVGNAGSVVVESVRSDLRAAFDAPI